MIINQTEKIDSLKNQISMLETQNLRMKKKCLICKEYMLLSDYSFGYTDDAKLYIAVWHKNKCGGSVRAQKLEKEYMERWSKKKKVKSIQY